MAKFGGRQPGAGRPKGSVGKRTQEIIAAATAKGITPLEYMLKILRDEKADPTRRDEMAKAAAPYVHAKLNSITASGPDGGPIQLGLKISFESPK